MTANELADKLDEIYTGTDHEDIKLAATMLRQQQAEIDELRQELRKKELQLDFMFKQELKSAEMIK